MPVSPEQKEGTEEDVDILHKRRVSSPVITFAICYRHKREAMTALAVDNAAR